MYNPNFFIVLFFSVFSFVVAVALILRMVIVYLKNTNQYKGKIYKIPQFFPKIKNRKISKVIDFVILNIILVGVIIFGVPTIGGSKGVGIENVTFEKLIYYVGLSLFSSLLLLGIFRIVEKSKISSGKLPISWRWEMIFWGIVLILWCYFGFQIQDKLWEIYYQSFK